MFLRFYTQSVLAYWNLLFGKIIHPLKNTSFIFEWMLMLNVSIGLWWTILPTQAKGIQESTPADTLQIDSTVKDILLKGVTVQSLVKAVRQEGDTLIFNPQAFRLQPGSKLEELIRRLPGVSIDKNGNITAVGKKVSEIRVDGKEFFKGNIEAALQNIVTDMVEQVKIYDHEDNSTRHSGVKEIEKPSIIDIELKEEYKESLSSALSPAIGANKKYQFDWNINKFQKHGSISLTHSSSNIDTKSEFDAINSLQAQKNASIEINWANKEDEYTSKRLAIYADATYNYLDDDNSSRTSTQTLLSNIKHQPIDLSNNVSRFKQNTSHANLSIEWSPDSLNWIRLASEGFLNRDNNRQSQYSLALTDSPFENSDFHEFFTTELNIPTAWENSLSNIHSYEFLNNCRDNYTKANFTYSHRFKNTNNVLMYYIACDYKKAATDVFSITHVAFPQYTDSTSFFNLYQDSPAKSQGVQSSLSYAHHFLPQISLKIAYDYTYSHLNQDIVTYALHQINGINPFNYPQLGWIPSADTLYQIRLPKNSQQSIQKQFSHALTASVYWEHKRWKITSRIKAQYLQSQLDFNQSFTENSFKRYTPSLSPQLIGQYQFSNSKQLRFLYHYDVVCPYLNNLIETADETDPLHITQGNSQLKDTHLHHFQFAYRSFNPKHQQTFHIIGTYNYNIHDIANLTLHNLTTGQQTSTLTNVNGNWQCNLAGQYNQTIDPKGKFRINANTHNSLLHRVALIQTDSKIDRNLMNIVNCTQSFALNYITEKSDFQLGADWQGSFCHGNTAISSPESAQVTTINSAIKQTIFQATTISSQFCWRQYKGYALYNNGIHREWLWNLGIEQHFFADRSLSLGIKFFDILNQRNNSQITASALSICETQYNYNPYRTFFFLNYRFSIKKNIAVR